LRINAERTFSILIITAFVLTSIIVYATGSNSLSREEAIDISRRSELVCTLMENADRHTLEVHYMNKTQVNKAREEMPWLKEDFPENRSVWTVTWYIHPEGAVSAFAYVVSHVIDAETGQILHEGWVSMR